MLVGYLATIGIFPWECSLSNESRETYDRILGITGNNEVCPDVNMDTLTDILGRLRQEDLISEKCPKPMGVEGLYCQVPNRYSLLCIAYTALIAYTTYRYVPTGIFHEFGIDKHLRFAAVCYKLYQLYPLINNVSSRELDNLIQSIRAFEEHMALDPNVEESYTAFLKYLKQGCRIEQLLTLVKLGCDASDCHIPVFEEVDAKEVCNRGSNSLQWLAAKAVTKHVVDVSNSTEAAVALAKSTKKYMG